MNRPLPDKVAGITVERKHVLTEEVPLSFTPKAVLHTTEGSLESAMTVFGTRDQPNLLIGRDSKSGKVRLIEYGGVGLMARALLHPIGTPETNRACRYQIEVAGFRQIGAEIKLTPDQKTMDAEFRKVLAEVWAFVSKEGGVPLKRGGDGSRSLSNWTTKSGWFGHVEVPNNDHTDPGGHDYAKTFALAASPDKYQLHVMSGEGQELSHSEKFTKGELGDLMTFALGAKDPEAAVRRELWDDHDVILRLKKV